MDSDNHDFVERRRVGNLTDQQIDAIAERAAEKAVEKITNRIYEEVGKSVVQKVVYVVGVAAVALAMWLNSKGFFTGG